MKNTNRPSVLSFTAGVIVYVLGTLMLCYCPWMFAISAVAFGIAAATAERQLGRWAAVIAVGLSAAMALGEATKKEHEQFTARELIRQIQERKESHSTPHQSE